MSTKSTFVWQFTGSEAENAMRKLVFAASVGIQDGTLSNLAQPLVRIALKLLMLLRAHRAAHAVPGAYVPLALRPADAEAVTDVMVAMQLGAFIKEGTLLPDEKYREAYRLVLDSMEQQLDAPGELGPLSLAKMKEIGAQLQVTLQSRGLSEVPRSMGFYIV